MRITKYMHSCLLVESKKGTVLIDPGVYSWQSGLFDISKIERIDEVVITHEHADHFHLPFIEEVVQKFPKVTVITTEEVAKQLSHLHVQAIMTESTDLVKRFTSKHNSLPFDTPGPNNFGVHIDDNFTDPGDSHTFLESKRILAMPMTAPWGSMVGSIAKISELKPEVVIPIHDWHWRPEALKGMYGWFAEELAQKGIRFILPVDGEPIDL